MVALLVQICSKSILGPSVSGAGLARPRIVARAATADALLALYKGIRVLQRSMEDVDPVATTTSNDNL